MGEDEPEIENIQEFNEEVCFVTPKPSQGTKIIEMEPHQQNDDEVEQGADTQELASLNILVEVGTQMGEDELEIENIL